jgi:hypothetical protein
MPKKVLSNKIGYEIDKGICAPCQLKENKNKKFKSCYSKKSLLKIANTWNKNHSSNLISISNKSTRKKLWDNIQNKFSKVCKKDELCWKQQDLIKKIKDIDIELYTFKPTMPKEWLNKKNTWLNTYDIYYVMKQYEKANPDFAFLGPIPSDCPVSIHCELSKLDLMNMKKNGIDKVGIIYNTDVSTSSGEHWVAIYIDNKHNEINYYDSTASIPIKLIHKFIEKVANQYRKHKIEPTIIYNDKKHQYGNSECGMYSMNFILERVHGKTMWDISNMKIPDSDMNYLRGLLYNNTTDKKK